MNTTATNRKVRLLMKALLDETLIPRPEFQRRLVWSNRHKNAFIETVLLGYPFPEIYVAAGSVDPDTGEGTEMLVDGQQRVTTLYQYFQGSPDLRLTDVRKYSELSREEKLAFLDYEVVVRDLGSKSIEEIKEIFKRINSTRYALNAMELHNARYDGEFKRFGEALAEDPFFEQNSVFTSSDIKRMGDVRFALTLVVTMMSSYFNRDEDLEEYLGKFNDEFPERESIEDRLQQAFAWITKCDLGKTSRAFQKADLLPLVIEVDRMLTSSSDPVDPGSKKDALADFYAEVSRAARGEAENKDAIVYYKATIQASNDRSNRITRGRIIKGLLTGGPSTEEAAPRAEPASPSD